jgi:hypothetical protein
MDVIKRDRAFVAECIGCSKYECCEACSTKNCRKGCRSYELCLLCIVKNIGHYPCDVGDLTRRRSGVLIHRIVCCVVLSTHLEELAKTCEALKLRSKMTLRRI